MKKETVKVPEDTKEVIFNKETGEITFLVEDNRTITEKIETFKDVLEYAGIEESDFYKGSEFMEDDEIAFRELKLITKVLNEGWVPNWDDRKEVKYYPYFFIWSRFGFNYCSYDFYGTDSPTPTYLVFKNEGLVKHAAEKFEEIYKRYFLCTDTKN